MTAQHSGVGRPTTGTGHRPGGLFTRVGREQGIRLLRTGYPYLLGLRRNAGGSRTVDLRLLGRRTTAVSGPSGARLFYDTAIMRRKGAIPRPLRRTLFGEGAVHGLDGAAHRHRKALFLGLLTPGAAREVAEIAADEWGRRPAARLDPAGVFLEAVRVHCTAVCRWAGTPDAVRDGVARDLIGMVDGFGSVGPRHVAARLARKRSERWAVQLIDAYRAGGRKEPLGSALEVVATHRDTAGELLPRRVAAVELLNILRPTVAVAYFIAFAADALQRKPELRDWLAGGGDERFEAFAHEVRRFYPFVPMLATRVQRRVRYDGTRLRRGERVLLDVYGTLHDPALWSRPERFDPERFVDEEPDPFTFIPQGGGDPSTGHRCPGERQAIELIKAGAHALLARPGEASASYDIPLDRMPTRPFPAHR